MHAWEGDLSSDSHAQVDRSMDWSNTLLALALFLSNVSHTAGQCGAAAIRSLKWPIYEFTQPSYVQLDVLASVIVHRLGHAAEALRGTWIAMHFRPMHKVRRAMSAEQCDGRSCCV